MCVIVCGNAANKPTPEQLRDCWGRNPHGAGAAWYDSSGRVTWRKGIRSLDEVIELVDGFTGAWVVHFRYITVGGDSDLLCHPFPISKDAPRSTEGSGNGAVLFHNGTVNEWRKYGRELALSHPDANLPDGALSDSRVVSWICAHKGYRFLRLLPGRYAVVTRNNGVRMFPSNGTGRDRWHEVDGVWYSNMDWRTLAARDGSQGATWSSGSSGASDAWKDTVASARTAAPTREEWGRRQAQLYDEDPSSSDDTEECDADERRAMTCESCGDSAEYLHVWNGREICHVCLAATTDDGAPPF